MSNSLRARGDQQLTNGFVRFRISEYKGSGVGSYPRFLRISLSCFSWVLLSIRP